jgi:uncharacterized protein
MSSFVLELAQLPQGSSQARLEADATDVGLPAEGWPGHVVGEVRVERNADALTVRGRVQGVARLECVRCLKDYEQAIEAPLEVFAERSGAGSRRDEVELKRDDYMLFHDGRRLDLSDEVRGSLLLELPMAPHCREDCAGLCPRCGADLNEGSCTCPDRVAVR